MRGGARVPPVATTHDRDGAIGATPHDRDGAVGATPHDRDELT